MISGLADATVTVKLGDHDGANQLPMSIGQDWIADAALTDAATAIAMGLIFSVVTGPYRVTYQSAYAAGGTFRHAYHPDGDTHAHAAGADLQHAAPAGNGE